MPLSVKVMEGSVFWENCRWMVVVAPSEGNLTHAGSATKTILSSVGGLVSGVLRIGITEHRRSDPAAVQDLLGWWPPIIDMLPLDRCFRILRSGLPGV